MSDQHNNNWNTHYTHGCRTGWTEPGAYWTPDPAGSYMEFMLVDTINNRIVLSASKNVDGTAKTWWLNMWGFLHPRKIISKDLVMYFRVKDVWGSDWLKWDGKDINRVKYVFRTGSPFQY